jgi:erythromycin esterase
MRLGIFLSALWLVGCTGAPGPISHAPGSAPSAAPAAASPSADAGEAGAAGVPAAVADYMREHARPLQTIEPGGERGDLAWLRDAVRGARIVGLGEQTHGTHEHARLKHRLVEALVRDAGFTAFAIEAPMLEIADLDLYGKTGAGDPERDAASLGFWCWKTEEVLDLVRWIRAYNADPTTKRKVSLYGFDMQKTPRATAVLLDYLARVDGARARRARKVLATFADPFVMADYATRWMKDADAIAELLAETQRFLAEKGSERARKTDPEALATAVQATRILQQYLTMERSDKPGNERDRAMAENVRWALDHEGEDGKVIVWAHNGHISAEAEARFAPLGHHLRTFLGEAYTAVGLFFDEGEFRAFAVPRTIGARTRTFRVGPAPTGTLEEALRTAASDRFGLTLRDLPEGGPVAAWFEAEHRERGIGWAFDPDKPDYGLGSGRPRRSYDILFYVKGSTATRPLASAEPEAFPVLDAPTDLDLEAADPARAWSVFGSAYGYSIAATRERPFQGASALVVARAAWPLRAEAFGGARQRVRAELWRGSTLHARLAARVDDARTDGARVWVRASRDAGVSSKEVGFAEMRVRGTGFRSYELTMAVPGDADTLDFGIALVGDGRAFLDAVVLEKVAGKP